MEAFAMEPIRQEAQLAELQGFQRALTLTLQTRGDLPNTRSQWREVRAIAIQRYREEWTGEHEIMSETGWVNGWQRGWGAGMWIRNGLDTTRWQLERGLREIREAIEAWSRERIAATPKPRSPRQPRRPKGKSNS